MEESRVSRELHQGGYATKVGSTWPGQKVAVGSTIDDWREKNPLGGVGKAHL